MKAVASQLGTGRKTGNVLFLYSVSMIKYPNKSDLWEKRFILVHSSKVQLTMPKQQEPEVSSHIMPLSGSRVQ